MPENVYQTYGTHNPPSVSPCTNPDCVYQRQADEPTDPVYPVHWTSNWRMYRVYNGYAEFPPPYNGKPPASLKEGVDYEVSGGTTYYDSEWMSPAGKWPGTGAMRESYQERCLPIFPIDNHFSCSFVSLGDTAFFQTYAEDRPAGMPEYCLFSPLNHPPARDFIQHLPYSSGDSMQLKNRVQAYSFWVDPGSGQPFQVGVKPDQTDHPGILFGYAFWRHATPDFTGNKVSVYRHPQSFYFSGFPAPPANAPIVSQNYTDFSMRQPPAETWSQVEQLEPDLLPDCHLFQPVTAEVSSNSVSANHAGEGASPPTWASIGR